MGAGRFSMIGTVIDGPPHEAVHLEYAEEVRAGETGAWREKIPAPLHPLAAHAFLAWAAG